MHLRLIATLFILIPISDRSALGDEAAMELFEQRIMPIFRSPKPSSCIQCHLASVDLKDYILPSSEETFLSLRDQGLINLDNPSRSKILTLIRMGDEDRDELAKRIHAKTREAELEAFTAWVHACCDDDELRSRPPLKSAVAKPSVPDEVIRHGRKDRVLDSFVRNVWSQRMRCFPCHTPGEIDPANPQHEKPNQRHREFVQQYGAKMNLFKSSPAETMRSMLAGNHKGTSKSLPLINLEDPTQSLFVLKPTSKLPPKNDQGKFAPPSSLPPTSHMGGLKMHVDDTSYKAIITWIEDVASIHDERYASATDLPADNWYPTKQVLRLKDTPDSWPDLGRVQLMVHSKNDSGGWHSEPVAFTQGTITPRGMVNGSLIVFKTDQIRDQHDWDAGGVALKPGTCLIKVYVDAENRLAEDPSAILGSKDFQGQVEIDAHWQEGFKNAEVVSAHQLSK